MRSTIALTLAGLALAAAGTSTASAAPPSKAARFETSITMTQTTTYDEPYHEAPKDCYHVLWARAEGRETWKVRTKSPTIAITRLPGGAYIDYGGVIDPMVGSLFTGIRAESTRTRSSKRDSGSNPGPCGGTGEPEPAPLTDDCGTRQFESRVLLDLRGGKVTPSVVPQPGETAPDDYSDCALLHPRTAKPGFNEASQDLPLSDLLDPEQRLHVVLGRKTWRERGDHYTATITVKWQLRMKRVDR